MSSVDDLRSTLEAHAHRVDDPGASPRVVAVHERVRLLRRRRRTTAGALAAAVLVAGVGVAGGVVGGTGGRDLAPAGPPEVVAGQQVPGTATLLDVDYEYVEALDVDPDAASVRIDLAAGDSPRAVSLVTSDLGGGVVTLVRSGTGVARSQGAGSVEQPVPVPGPGELRVVLQDVGPEAQVGVAVYEQGDEPPAGVVAPGGAAWFRAERAGAPLLAGGFSDPGSSELEVVLEVDSSERVRFSTFCTASTRGAWVNLDIADQPGWSRASCDEEAAGDASGSWGSMTDPLEPGTYTLRAYLTRGSDGPRVEDPEAVLGVAAYAEPGTVEVDGVSVDRTVEAEGRLWELEATLTATREGEPLPRRVAATPGPRLVGFTARGGIVGLRVDASRAGSKGLTWSRVDARGGASTILGVLLGGDDYELTLREDRGRDVAGTILLYRPVS